MSHLQPLHRLRGPDASRTASVLAHVAQLAIAFAVLDRGGAPAGRQALLALFATTFWFRMTHRATSAPRGAFSWRDSRLAMAATGAYQLGFAILGTSSAAPLGPSDALAVAAFASGSALGSLCDAVRLRLHARAPGGAALCTRGAFAYVRYPRYAGDVLWSAGWALATGARASWVLVAAHSALVVFVYVPALERRLSLRYGSDYRAWAARTARLIPFVY
jgi:protein-S-isoprenylcysteine O-methyltransferase Ste14